MQPQSASSKKANPLATLQILWAAMLVTQGIFVVIARTATMGQMSPPDEMPRAEFVGSLPVPMFAALAFVSLLLAVFLPKLIAKKRLEQIETGAGPVALEQLVPIAVTSKIIRWAMLESITLYGLILSLTNADPNLILPFAAVALIGFAMSFPNEKGIRQAIGAK